MKLWAYARGAFGFFSLASFKLPPLSKPAVGYWCGVGKPLMRPLLVSTQQVSRRPLGCFHKLEELLLQSGIPLWLGTFLRCPPASAALFYCSVLLKLLLLAELVARGFFKVPGRYQNSRQTLAVLKTSLQILEILSLGGVLQFKKVNVVSNINFSRKLSSDLFLHLSTQILFRAAVTART